MLNYVLGNGHHRFEFGAGLVLLNMSARATGFANDVGSGLLVGGAGCAAHRYAALDGGFNFKVGLTPTLASFGFYPTLGVSLWMLL